MKEKLYLVVSAITAAILMVIWLIAGKYAADNENVILSGSDFSSESVVLDGITIDDDILTFERPTSNILLYSTESLSLNDLQIYVEDIYGVITCQIFYTIDEVGAFSADHCSGLTSLDSGLNVIRFPEDHYYAMRLTFRCTDYTEAKLKLSYISMPDSIVALSTALSIAIVLVSIIVIFKWGIGCEKKDLIKKKFICVTTSRNFRFAVFVLLAYITTIALTIRFASFDTSVSSGSSSIINEIDELIAVISETSPIVQLIIFISVCSLLNVLYKRIEKKVNVPAFIFSLIMTITTMCGDSFYYQDSLDMIVTRDFARIVINIIVFIGYETVFYLMSAFLWETVVNFDINKILRNEKGAVGRVYGVYKKHPVIFLAVVILLFWLPYAIMYYPGIIPPDTTVQIDMLYSTREWNNGSPYFSTLLIGSFIELGRLLGSDNLGVCLFSTTQMIILAFTMSVCVNILKDFCVPRIVRIIWFMSICILPVFPCSAIQVGKDTNYTVSVIIFTIILLYIIKEPDKYISNTRILIFWTIDMLYMSLVRHNGIYVLLLSAATVFLFIRKRKYFIRMLACFVAVVVSFNLLNVCFDDIIEKNNIAKGYEVEEKNDEYVECNAMHTVIYNITARYIREYSAEITEEQRQIIDNVLKYDRISVVYQPEITDYVAAQFRSDVTPQEYNAFLLQFVKLFFKHPLVYFEGFFNKCYGYIYTNSAGKAKQYVWLGINSYIKTIPEVNIANIPEFSRYHVGIYHLMTLFRNMPVVSVLCNVGIYSWILVYVIFVLIKKKRYRFLFVTIPIIASLAVCILSPVNAYIRYALPVIFAAPMLLAPCFIKIKQED